jgi:hypothetical protein
MNLRHHTETSVNVEHAEHTLLSEPVVGGAAAQPLQARYEPQAVVRIIERASDLQETHQQTLSPAQIEAIAAEVGIRPEFVHQALELEKAGLSQEPQTAVYRPTSLTPAETRRRVGLAILAHFAFAVVTLGLVRSTQHYELMPLFAFIVPAALALILGGVARLRRVGAAAGTLVGASVVAAILTIMSLEKEALRFSVQDIQIFWMMVGGGTLLGITGAEVRRVVEVSRRQRTNRSRLSGGEGWIS